MLGALLRATSYAAQLFEAATPLWELLAYAACTYVIGEPAGPWSTLMPCSHMASRSADAERIPAHALAILSVAYGDGVRMPTLCMEAIVSVAMYDAVAYLLCTQVQRRGIRLAMRATSQ